MATRKKVAKPRTPAAQEQEMISLAYEQARSQMINGTAPASTVNYFLKLGSTREVIERGMIEKQVELLQAKADSIKNNKEATQAYNDAINAIKSYGYSGSAN